MNSSFNNNYGLSEAVFQLLLDAFAQFDEIEKVTLFGSRAMGNFKAGSDIDLALTGDRVNLHTITSLSAMLNEEMPIPNFVDILDVKTIDLPSLLKHINSEGKEIYFKAKVS